MKKEKILMISPTGLANGGVQAVIMSIIRNLSHKYEFDIVCNIHQDFYKEEFESFGGKVHYILNNESKIGKKFDYYLRYYRTLHAFEKLLKHNGPYKAIHCHNAFESAIFLKVAQRAGIKIRIIQSHNTEPPKKRKNKLFYLYNKKYRKDIQKCATKMIGCSKDACKYLFGNTSFEVVNNAINLDKFDIQKYPCKTNSELSFLHVGRFTYQKNQLFLLDVFSKILLKYPDSKLKIVGFGPDEEKIRNKVTELNLSSNVEILPHDTDIPKLMSISDFLLFPSTYEGLGIVVVESQAMHLHCFISDAVPEEANLGNCTYISLKNNSEQWSEIICEYIQNNGATKKSVDMSSYDIKNVIKKYDEIYIGE